MEHDDIDSRYPKLEAPRFDSKIPAHLLNRLSDQEKWLVETLSKIDQKADWFMVTILRVSENQRAIDVRLTKVERFTGKWALIGAGCLMVLTALLSEGARVLWGKIFP